MNQENNKPRVVLHDKTFELSIPYAELDKAIAALGDKINEDYKDVETPLFLGVLNGAFNQNRTPVQYYRQLIRRNLDGTVSSDIGVGGEIVLVLQ